MSLIFLTLSACEKVEKAGETVEDVQEVNDNTSALLVLKSDKGFATGTAWSINKEGYWVTAEHVVEDCEKGVFINYGEHDGRDDLILKDRYLGKMKLHKVEVIGVNKKRDLAVLRGEKNFEYISLSESAFPDKDHEAFVFGYPAGKEGHIVLKYTGKRARFKHEILSVWDVAYKSDGVSRLNGMSGSPVIDRKGEVFGTLVMGGGGYVLVATSKNIRSLVEENRLHVDLPSRYKRTLKRSNMAERDQDVRNRKIITKVYCRQ